jgi:hypothetical protein
MPRRIIAITGAMLAIVGLARTSHAQSDWTDELERCARQEGITTLEHSEGGADIVVANNGTFVTAEISDELVLGVAQYISCMIDAGVVPGWFFAVMDQTSDSDGLQALSFGVRYSEDIANTVLWSYDTADATTLIIVTTSEVTLQ